MFGALKKSRRYCRALLSDHADHTKSRAQIEFESVEYSDKIQRRIQRRFIVIELPFLMCANCALPILLPSPTHPCTPLNRLWWPMDAMPRNFLCRKCKHVFEYSSEHVQIHFFDGLDPRLTHRGRSVVRIEAPCGKQGCVALVTILAVMENDSDPP